MLTQSMPERHTRRAMDSMWDLFRASIPSSGLLWAISDGDPQRQCRGCREICQLIRWGEVQRRRNSAFQGTSSSRILHSSYSELDVSAGRSGCESCRLIRRAFLLEHITRRDADRLAHSSNQWPIHAVLNLSSSGDSVLELAVKSPKAVLFSATVHLSNDPRSLPRNQSKGVTGVRSDLSALRRVIDDCHLNHECSSRYRWSRRNPTWLLRILPDNFVQLVEGPSNPVDYVVLSYTWGDPATMPTAEWARIKGAGTKTINGRPVPERLSPFRVWELPETMQDAITISASLGVFYIWIDNVCIPKGTNWDTEASLMHEVYGNSAFTLVASSSAKATDRLLHDRVAWTHPSKACQLREMWWLQNTQTPLDRVRFEAPVSMRAWTLQEERLSPRIVYWAGQRWYWSCPECQVVETGELEWAPSAADETPRSCPQRFLELCRTGDEHLLHGEWLDIVEAYTRRDLVAPRDRFLAIAGLAVRFYNAKAGTGGAVVTEDYLAGLWKDNFARHLAWSVAGAVDSQHNLQHIAPSWSWASLPLRVHTDTKALFKTSEHFKFIAVKHIDPASASTTFTRPETGDRSTDYINRGRAVEERGRGVKVVEVQGRFRRFISQDAMDVSWDDIEWKRGEKSSFNFGAFPGQGIYARNRASGKIISKDAHIGEVVGQLDYLVPPDGKPRDGPTPYIRPGGEKEIVCLELGELAMLLLVPIEKCGQPESYQRVGVAIGYTNRKGFFYGSETRRILLA
ncbi:heterokaryon incompatibility protein-domain-containing protein [Chaetomium fimeti]|uniref:Heterokaryon incompatibility protein-domain-containing protein n=1 Tax=Chaetomium fimeti TaxID=1854472 RepID=A0AAE0HLX4_9PEZI|nr:heterokaryon incompatibility protein-domain-containing protein [Chaetomium fimeti]